MKPVISYGIVNADTSGPGAFLRAAKWYWDELTDMFAAAGFTSVMIPMVPNTENVSRNGAPICTASIRTRFGSPEGYLAYLNEKGIGNVEVIGVSAQSMYNSLFETGLSMDRFFDGFYEYAMDCAKALKELRGSTLLVSPTPGIGFLNLEFNGDEEKIRKFYQDAAAAVNRIGADVKALGLNTVVRNEYWTLMRGEEINSFTALLDQDVVTYAPDPAHLMIAGADYKGIFRAYAGKAEAVCFTDTAFTDECGAYKTISPEFPQEGKGQRVYWDLGFGKVDFDAIYEILKNAGFDGPVVLDPHYSLDIPKGILRARTFWNNLEKNYAKKEVR